MTHPYRYPWPASALGPKEMAMLHQRRESLPERTPITRLIAEAVRAAYGTVADISQSVQEPPLDVPLRPAA